MNNCQSKVINKTVMFNNVSTSDHQNSVLISVPNNPVTLPTTTTYFIQLDQTEGTLIRIDDNEVKYLDGNNVNVNARDEMNALVCEDNLNDTTKPPLGSSENPIHILHNGEKLLSTQNISKAQLELIAKALQAENKTATNSAEEMPINNFVYKVVYPEELDLKRTLSEQTKRGRPKKRPPAIKEPIHEQEKIPVKNVRTRSGRITRPPRHIEKDFKKIEISEHDENEMEVVTTDFAPIPTQNPTNENEPKLAEPLQNHQKKRNISSQYRCPVCKKAYMGRSRMIKHLQKYPDHGPLPDHCKDNNFETWNYLVDITQKCPVGSRGKKFCEELTNLLHNLKILTKMLFKPSAEAKNNVQVDKVLGNALNLAPGNYKFNETELYKDVNVFTLLEDNRFFEENLLNENAIKPKNDSNSEGPSHSKLEHKNKNKESENILNFNGNKSPSPTGQNKHADQMAVTGVRNQSRNEGIYTNSYINESINLELSNLSNDKIDSGESHKIYSSHQVDAGGKKMNDQNLIRSDLLSDNSLLSSLPNLRNSVDELMLPVDTGPVSNLLDNSVSSDEVMNVDQFVNERFKKITEPDMELHSSINLDLHSLDIFSFHSS